MNISDFLKIYKILINWFQTNFWIINQFLADRHINDVTYVYECAFGFSKQV